MAVAITVVLFAVAFINSVADAAVVEHVFYARNMTVRRLCEDKVIATINGQFPGPTIEVSNGDTVVVHVFNELPYGITIHWHGVTQLLSAWADGVNMITQCPIPPQANYTHRFNVTGQEGTLWWHAHISYLRATVHGAFIIRPKEGPKAYPFPQPHEEAIIVLGEWWKANVFDVEKEVLRGIFSNISDAFTINGKPGNLYMCSNGSEDTYQLEVDAGKTYLLRIINAALDNQLFYKVAGHTFTVVAVDASYTKPYDTDVIVIAPGQTIDALMVANAAPARYYMAAQPYATETPRPPYFENTTARGILQYKSALPSLDPIMPLMPALRDTSTAYGFYNSLVSLLTAGQPTVPHHVDEKMLIIVGMGSICKGSQTPCKLNERRVVASMNNVSFQPPTKMPLLEAHYKGIEGIYTRDFPDNPPVSFDFTKRLGNEDPLENSLELTGQGTKVKKFKYNTTVEIVLQSTAILATQSHPVHLHGYNFFILAQGFGNYNPNEATKSYNLIDPLVRNTVAIPTDGWVAIRFVTNNPGVWYMHCHMDLHLPIGMATVIEVENGPTADTTLPPPPPDLPQCAFPDGMEPEKIKKQEESYTREW